VVQLFYHEQTHAGAAGRDEIFRSRYSGRSSGKMAELRRYCKISEFKFCSIHARRSLLANVNDFGDFGEKYLVIALHFVNVANEAFCSRLIS
jgi:hypothetical protein